MIERVRKFATRLGLVAVAACAVCCLPLAVPLISGAGVLGSLLTHNTGYLFAALAGVVSLIAASRLRMKCGCRRLTRCDC